MISCGSDHQRTLGHFLTAHIAEVDIVIGKGRVDFLEPRWHGVDVEGTGEEGSGFG